MKRMTTSAKSSKPKSHDDYLAAVTEDKRGALQKLRKAIKMAAPKPKNASAINCSISCEWKISGRLRAATNHCAFYPGSQPSLIASKRRTFG